MKKSPLAPRSPLVAEALKRKAGAHMRTRKAQRRADRIELLARLNGRRDGRGEEGGFSTQAHAVCLGGRIARFASSPLSVRAA